MFSKPLLVRTSFAPSVTSLIIRVLPRPRGRGVLLVHKVVFPHGTNTTRCIFNLVLPIRWNLLYCTVGKFMRLLGKAKFVPIRQKEKSGTKTPLWFPLRLFGGQPNQISVPEFLQDSGPRAFLLRPLGLRVFWHHIIFVLHISNTSIWASKSLSGLFTRAYNSEGPN